MKEVIVVRRLIRREPLEFKLTAELFGRGPSFPVKPNVSAAPLAAIFSGFNETNLTQMLYIRTTVLWLGLKMSRDTTSTYKFTKPIWF